MTREQAIEKLKTLRATPFGDFATTHPQADDVLCDLLTALGYEDVVADYLEVGRWFE